MKVNNDSRTYDKTQLYTTRKELTWLTVLACLWIIGLAVCVIFSLPMYICAPAAFFGFLISAWILRIACRSTKTVVPREDIFTFLASVGGSIFARTSSPVAVYDSVGTVLWYNDSARAVLPDTENYLFRSVSDMLGVLSPDADLLDKPLKLGDRTFRTELFPLGTGLTVLKLDEQTEQLALRKKMNDDRVAIAYITIDNVEDVLQYVHEQFHDAVSAVDAQLKNWAESMHGIIKAYDDNKYIMAFDSACLDACIADRFSILDEIRSTRLGDGVSITVSVGVSRQGETLAQREENAREAIDLAMQRGGDQAVYKTEEGVEFYGGRTKNVYKRTNVRSRTVANQLCALMARAENVMIMGHKGGDYDSFGASVGLYRLAVSCGVKANVALDLHEKSLMPVLRYIRHNKLYDDVFVDGAEALGLCTTDTLLICVDHGSVKRSQFPNIAERVRNVVIIDHHRKNEIAEEPPVLLYNEPSASSACELVTEMLQSTLSSRNLEKEEADLLLAGILLDTKQFTRNTGTRTFGAAQYLRSTGADMSDIGDLFRIDPDELTKEARFHTKITMYRNGIAISACDGENDESYRVVAAKAADKMLTLRNVSAAFTLVRIGGSIFVSGRSSGTVNVGLILEKLHGGGHFNMAGAQFTASSVIAVLDKLKAAIDEYFEN